MADLPDQKVSLSFIRGSDYLPANDNFKKEDLALGPRGPKPSKAGQGCPNENVGRPQYTSERRQRQTFMESVGSVSGSCYKVGGPAIPKNHTLIPASVFVAAIAGCRAYRPLPWPNF